MRIRNPLLGEVGRFAMTVAAIGACTLMMVFLWATYQSVNAGAVDYIRRTRADIWMLQANATNIIRGSSIMTLEEGQAVLETKAVASASPVLLLLSSVKLQGRFYTLFLTGYRREAPTGGPPIIAAGRALAGDDEIVLDEVFARKHHLVLGQTLEIQGVPLQVVGLSRGTNAMVIQYAFVSLERAQGFIQLPGLISFVAIRIGPGETVPAVLQALRAAQPEMNFFSDAQFIENNVLEMQTGFLAFLFIITLMGALVLAVILALLLSLDILERRRDFVIMKALGAPRSYLRGLVAAKALLLGGCGGGLGLALFLPLRALVRVLAPELETQVYPAQMALVLAGVLVICLASALVATRRIAGFYALEAFRARGD
ncbi:MAG: ABC transporter permease [Geothrix sp.]|uniref:ABC transporter permease n=1 Tax=Geothrix sp. TaxID=1962974 RepID=UPI00185B2742|nr:ABC transporter permease [Geothrix sp.]NWJ42027.1 ABC transporter permease [Geothrix sp.]WIL20005.1 MAG: ABC transporter permease [Geothrix sp.]